jgi:hypothetical protein
VKRTLLVLTVALLMAVMLVVTVAPAFALNQRGIDGRNRGADARVVQPCLHSRVC